MDIWECVIQAGMKHDTSKTVSATEGFNSFMKSLFANYDIHSFASDLRNDIASTLHSPLWTSASLRNPFPITPASSSNSTLVGTLSGSQTPLIFDIPTQSALITTPPLALSPFGGSLSSLSDLTELECSDLELDAQDKGKRRQSLRKGKGKHGQFHRTNLDSDSPSKGKSKNKNKRKQQGKTKHRWTKPPSPPSPPPPPPPRRSKFDVPDDIHIVKLNVKLKGKLPFDKGASRAWTNAERDRCKQNLRKAESHEHFLELVRHFHLHLFCLLSIIIFQLEGMYNDEGDRVGEYIQLPE